MASNALAIIRRHIAALRHAFRVARMAYRNELRDEIPF